LIPLAIHDLALIIIMILLLFHPWIGILLSVTTPGLLQTSQIPKRQISKNMLHMVLEAQYLFHKLSEAMDLLVDHLPLGGDGTKVEMEGMMKLCAIFIAC